MPRVKLPQYSEPSREEEKPVEWVCGEVESKPLRRVRIPGTNLEVDEQGYVHVPDNLLRNLFP